MHSVPYYGQYYPYSGVWPKSSFPAYFKPVIARSTPSWELGAPYDISSIQTSSSSTLTSTYSSSSPLSSYSSPSLFESAPSHTRTSSSAHSVRSLPFTWQRRRRVAFLIDRGRHGYDPHQFLCPGDSLWLSSPLPTPFHPKPGYHPRSILKRHVHSRGSCSRSSTAPFPQGIFPYTSKADSKIPRSSLANAKRIPKKAKVNSSEEYSSESCEPLPHITSSRSKVSSAASSKRSMESTSKRKVKSISSKKVHLKRRKRNANMKIIKKETQLLNKIEKLLSKLSDSNSIASIEKVQTSNCKNTIEPSSRSSNQVQISSSPPVDDISSATWSVTYPSLTTSHPINSTLDTPHQSHNSTCSVNYSSIALPTKSSLCKPPHEPPQPATSAPPQPTPPSTVQTEKSAVMSSSGKSDDSNQNKPNSQIQEDILKHIRGAAREELRRRALLKIVDVLFKLKLNQTIENYNGASQEANEKEEIDESNDEALRTNISSQRAKHSMKRVVQDWKQKLGILNEGGEKEKEVYDGSETIETLVSKFRPCEQYKPPQTRIYKLRSASSESDLDSVFYHAPRTLIRKKLPFENYGNRETKYVSFNDKAVKLSKTRKKQQNVNPQFIRVNYNSLKPSPSHKNYKHIYNSPDCSECSDDDTCKPRPRGQKLRRAVMYDECNYRNSKPIENVRKLIKCERFTKRNGSYSTWDTRRCREPGEQETYQKPFVVSAPRTRRICVRRKVSRVIGAFREQEKNKKASQSLPDRFKPDMWVTSNLLKNTRPRMP